MTEPQKKSKKNLYISILILAVIGLIILWVYQQNSQHEKNIKFMEKLNEMNIRAQQDLKELDSIPSWLNASWTNAWEEMQQKTK